MIWTLANKKQQQPGIKTIPACLSNLLVSWEDGWVSFLIEKSFNYFTSCFFFFNIVFFFKSRIYLHAAELDTLSGFGVSSAICLKSIFRHWWTKDCWDRLECNLGALGSACGAFQIFVCCRAFSRPRVLFFLSVSCSIVYMVGDSQPVNE